MHLLRRMHSAQSGTPLRVNGFCHQSVGEVGLSRSNLVQSFPQVGTEVAQVFDASDDALLFGEGRNREGATFQLR